MGSLGSELWTNSTSNESVLQCAYHHKCAVRGDEAGKFGAVAGIRMIISLLSLIGALSIIISALIKRQVKSAKVHPIFMLSIADTLLALLWVVGGAMWVFRDYITNRVVCLPISLLTMILECVTINLTLVYAIIAHAHIKQTDLNSILVGHTLTAHDMSCAYELVNTVYYMYLLDDDVIDHLWYILQISFNRSEPGWPWMKVVAVYFSAWLFPVLLVIIPFMFIVTTTGLLDNTNRCSCWCAPLFSNILPVVRTKDNDTMMYMMNIKRLGVAYTTVVVFHYLVVFPLLVIFYSRILNHIRTMRRNHMKSQGSNYYGATKSLIVKGHSQAKTRVLLFLLVFIVSGLCNLILAFVLMVHFSIDLQVGMRSIAHHSSTDFKTSVLIIRLIQSITVPLQGFLNAIVYGWTREDFLYIMASTSKQEDKNQVNSVYIQDGISSDVDESSFYDSSYQNMSRQQTPECLSGNF